MELPALHTIVEFAARALGSAIRSLLAFAGFTGAAVAVRPNVAAAVDSIAVPRDEALDAVRPRRVLIVGAGAVGRQMAEDLWSQGGYDIVGFIDDAIETGSGQRWRVLGSRADAPAIVKEQAIDEVFVAYAPSWQQRLAESLATEYPDVDVRIAPTAYEALLDTAVVEKVGDIALIRLAGKPKRSAAIGKRVFDVIVASTMLVACAPLMLVIALLIRLTSRGEVIFRQERIGLNGRPFTLYKFRTMASNAEAASGPVLSTGMDDLRMTKLGRWLRRLRLDELPQLWNVLQGTMSVVGPRPERPFFVQQFERSIPMYARRHEVRPGITGLAQVCGGYHTDARDKLRFDLLYVSHQSVGYDLRILFRTIAVVLRPGRGAL